MKLAGQVTVRDFYCVTDQFRNDLLAKDEQYAYSERKLESEYVVHFSQPSFQRGNISYELPIVVHIIHNGGVENISDIQVQNAINYLNDAFKNQNSFYTDFGIETDISFCLAARDPNNNPSNGITRTSSVLTHVEYSIQDQLLKNLILWNPKEYINVWVVNEICVNGDCQVAGYSTFPPSHGGPVDGIVIEASYFGTIPSNTTSFIHEMGHYLGLGHTFLGGCKNDNCLTDGDKVCDTPPDKIVGYLPCSLEYNSCTTDENDYSIQNPFRPISLGGIGDQPDMFQNFMDYSAGECQNRFSPGQVKRMEFFLEHQRKSLSNSYSCYPPCPNPVTANFTTDFVIGVVDDESNLINISTNAGSYEWFINNTLYSTNEDSSILFNFEGTYTIKLIVHSSILGCSSDSFSVQINITCPTVSEFSLDLIDNSIYLANSSVNSTNIIWSIVSGSGVNIYSSIKNLDTFNFIDPGYYQICLRASGELCSDSLCKFIRIYTLGSEICNNGIDDDGDHLIDLFDPDCFCEEDAYQAQCEIDCEAVPDSFPDIKLQLKWISGKICNYEALSGNIVCGDIDNDGTVEILSSYYLGMKIPVPPLSSAINGIEILSGQDGSIKNNFSFTPNGVRGSFTNLAISKDAIGLEADVYFLDFISNRIVRYDRWGNRKWESEPFVFPHRAILNFADFNGDGVAEIYMNSIIFNSETGKILAFGKQGIGGNKNGSAFNSFLYAHSIAGDFLPNPGLELAAGNTVYIVQLNNLSDSTGNFMIPVVASAGIIDGSTGMGDFDNDQSLDIVSCRSNSAEGGGGLWILNPRTAELIAKGATGIGGGIPAIGDLDGDCVPEIVIAFEQQLIVYGFDGSQILKTRYVLPTSDQSGLTSIALFDFNLDGRLEIIYRDETHLLIINGNNGTIIDSYPVLSKTALEGPIIADIDNDGASEIIVTGSITDYNEMRILAFESASEPWAPSRTVWNQIGYHVTNVNDDLTIPKEPQNIAIQIPGSENCTLQTCPNIYNNFMAQATNRTQEGCVQFPALDLIIQSLGYSCSPDSITLCIEIQNNGNQNLSARPVEITFWKSNPLSIAGIPLLTKSVVLSLQNSERDTICITDTLLINVDSIYVVINDPGTETSPYTFPLTDLLECNYQNNLYLIDIDLTPKTLDLGLDIIKCNSSVVTFTADAGFENYVWNDGSTGEQFSTSFPGVYFVNAFDQCQRIYSDTIQVSIEEPININLGVDQIICPLDTLEFTVQNSFEWIQWVSSAEISCDTCISTFVTSDTSFLLIAIAGNGDCIVQDSVNIEVVQTEISEIFESICANEKIEFYGDSLNVSGIYSHLSDNCDSLIYLNLNVYQPSFTNLITSFCEGDSIEVGGEWFFNSGIYNIKLNNANNCDSTITLSLDVLLHAETNLSETICLGDSISFNGNWISDSGNYTCSLSTLEGCDSTVYLNLVVETEIIQKDEINLCDGDSIFLFNQWVNSPGVYSDTIQQPSCDLIFQTEAFFNPNYLNNVSLTLCQGDSVWTINRWIYTEGVYSIALNSDFGCDSLFNIIIEESPNPPEPIVEIDCQIPSVNLTILSGNLWHIIWDNGDTSQQTVYFNSDTARWIIYSDPLCKADRFLALPAIPDISVLPVFSDTTISKGSVVSLMLNIDPVDWKIKWISESGLSCDTCITISIYPEDDTEVTLMVTHRETGCTFSQSFRIYLVEEGDLYVPSVFSPNGDLINDFWSIGISGNVTLNSVSIFDRWGNQVGNWKGTNQIDWDGKFNGTPMQSGVFAYIIKYTKNQESFSRSGDLTLIR
ncbi:MAG TPA: M43 family zinc metalloprotease [Saprospiraceae bacterium]|nr:M43 family zinc metalloprotease [Saprospiraceae bacterium]